MLSILLLFAGAAPAAPPVFEKDILPVFQAKCLRCHGDKKQSADLDLRSKAALVHGGESGSSLQVGAPEKSLLWIKIAGDKMPPGKDKLTAEEKALVHAWIAGGAKDDGTTVAAAPAGDRQVSDADRQFWSFQPPKRPTIPTVKARERVRTPIDAFLLAALEAKGLTFSPEAEKLTLLRRACFDLTGLPPTPRQMEDFLADTSADAFDRLLDRLLASPAYGERWGRHWLDLAGYADSEGILDADYVRTHAWRYRDYVIRAFNADKPYDRFLQEQIAGDELTGYWQAHATQKELPTEVIEGLIATGFLRCASDTSRPDFVNIKNAPGYYYQTLDDTLKIVASSTMGLTVHCAKCHSHKYDPIPQTDYYRMQAIFTSAYRPAQWVPQVQRRLLEATASQEAETAAHNKQIDAAIAELNKQLEANRQQLGERYFAEQLATLPAVLRDDVKAAFAADPMKRTEVQKYLVGKLQPVLQPERKVLLTHLARHADLAAKEKALTEAITAENGKRRTLAEIRAIYDLPGEAKTPLLRRGDYLNPGPEMQPGVLSVLATRQSFQHAPPAKDAKSSGRRLAFANWLTQPDHPLTARVMVNRLWLHHFGEGLVSTPENFGRTGSPPSHPELLDWLATEFVARGWSMKAMHRLMMTSTAYRQVSGNPQSANPNLKSVDPENRLLWRQRLRRVEAEVLRDSVLAVAGTLNPEMYGTPVPMVRQADGEIVTPNDASGHRRSVYLQVRRSQPLTILQVFDQPVLETNCTRRSVSTVSSQALTLLNSDFLLRQAEAFAERVQRENAADPVGQAVRLAFGRPVSEREHSTLAAFLRDQTARHAATPEGRTDPARRAMVDLCHMLLGANEFIYVD